MELFLWLVGWLGWIHIYPRDPYWSFFFKVKSILELYVHIHSVKTVCIHLLPLLLKREPKIHSCLYLVLKREDVACPSSSVISSLLGEEGCGGIFCPVIPPLSAGHWAHRTAKEEIDN